MKHTDSITDENYLCSMATLKIYNDIRTESDNNLAVMFGDVEGVTFKDIDTFCESIAEDDNRIDIRLHCNGGSVTEGWAIYDRLRATGKEITATVEGNCASMATIILMAAPKERRRAYQNAHILVHNPWMPVCEMADADDLQRLSDDLRAEQEKMLNLYVERCGCSREDMQTLMNEDKYIDTETAMTYGIIGEIVPPMSAHFFSHKKINAMNLIEKLKALISSEEETQGMDLNTADGDVLHVEREDGEPQVGDKASPDGEFLMPDGVTIVVVEGVITEIKPVEAPAEGEDEDGDEKKGEDDTTELDDRDEEEQRLRERIAELEKENEELRQQLEEKEKNAKTKDDLRILNLVKMAGGEQALAQLKSTYKPQQRSNDGARVSKKANDMTAKDIINRQKEAYNQKKKEK